MNDITNSIAVNDDTYQFHNHHFGDVKGNDFEEQSRLDENNWIIV